MNVFEEIQNGRSKRIAVGVAAVLAVFAVELPAAAAGSGADGDGAAASESNDGEASNGELKERLRELEAKYQKTGNSKYLFERVLTLEKMGEYDFALEVLRENRESFESNPEVNGVAVVEQRLIDASGAEGGRSGSGSNTKGKGRKDSGGLDILGITFTSVGAAALAGGILELALAESRAKELRCSPASQGPDASGCEGVEVVRFESKSEFEDAKSNVRTQRTLGVGLTVVGAGLAGYGVYRLVSGGGKKKASRGLSRPRVAAGLAPDGAALRLEFDF